MVNDVLNRKVLDLYQALLGEGKIRSQKEFCQLIDWSEPSFCHVVSNKRSFPKNKIPILVTVFKLSRDYFEINSYYGVQDICDKIIHIRKLKDLTQRDFAKKLNVTQAAISAIENKTNKQPGYDILWGLINRLKVNPYFLFSNDQIVFDSGKKFSNRAKIDQAISHINEAVSSLTAVSI